MKVALAQINPTVGDLAGNAAKIVDFSRRAADAGAAVVVFPELALIGYPPKDLLLKGEFVDGNLSALDHIARRTAGVDVIVGYAERNAAPVGRPLHNAVALLRGGRVVSRHFKTLLPTYDVFDESRYFEPGPNDRQNNLIRVCREAGDADDCVPTGISICEDLWNDERLIPRRLYHQNPILELQQAGAKLLVNSSASPFVAGKHDFRRELFSEQVRRIGVPLVYVNQVGGNDELVFDGNSVAFDAAGNLIAQAKEFEEDLLVVEIEPAAKGVESSGDDRPTRGTTAGGDAFHAGSDRAAAVSEKPGKNRIERHSNGTAAIHKALVLGLRDYVTKCGFSKTLLGLSGGIDSAVVCALAVEAFGSENVTGVAMPGRYSSGGSVDDARDLAANCGIAFHVVPIKPMHDAFEQALADPLDGVKGLTEENLQARIRGATLMAFSNKTGALLLTTGNKSELAVGYCTLYGDMCGGLAVISDLPKTDVYRLAEHINATAGREVIPRSTITKPPSAELAPDQKDTDSLPPYDVLDAILFRYVELDEGVDEMVARGGFDRETVEKIVKLTDRSEYKRRQAAPGLKVTSRAFGFGRRMPIAQRYTKLTSTHGEPSPDYADAEV